VPVPASYNRPRFTSPKEYGCLPFTLRLTSLRRKDRARMVSPSPLWCSASCGSSGSARSWPWSLAICRSGSAPDGADITYGSDSDNRSPQGGLGALGSGAALPWQGSMRYRSGALYYDVTAQLQGGGDIACKVRVRVTQFYSDGTHISKAKTVASGHASGGYNICDAQAENF